MYPEAEATSTEEASSGHSQRGLAKPKVPAYRRTYTPETKSLLFIVILEVTI